ncbi:MAG TPA: c-type cytochrome, partial [Planctomycetota bacterium]|nr:c-type cytochrome [Planctomycetota bacterium]
MTDSNVPPDMAAKIAAIKAKMAGAAGAAAGAGAAPGAGTPATPGAPAPATAPAASAPAGGTSAAAAGGTTPSGQPTTGASGPAAGPGGDMAAKIAAIKAKMGGAAGGPPVAAPSAAAPAVQPTGPSSAAPAGGKPTPPPAVVPAGASPASGPGTEAELAARVAALKAKMEAGKGATAPAAVAAAAAASGAPQKLPPPPTPKSGGTSARQIFPVEPIDRTSFGDDRLYRGATLNRWFSIGGIMLLVMVVWMLEHDWVRDWKSFQGEFREYKIAGAKAALEKADASIDPQVMQAAQQDVAKGQQAVAARQAQLAPLLEKKSHVEGEYYRNNQAFQFAKSKFDAERYQYEELRLAHGGDPEKLKDSDERLAAMRKDLVDSQAAADASLIELESTKAEIAKLQAAQADAEKKLAALTEQRDGMAGRLAKIDHSLFNDYIRNAPIADMLAPSEKIDQIVLDRLKDNYNFMYVGKVDRCTTCHLGIDDPAFSGPAWDEPGKSVFKAHPRLDLFVADGSPHPKGKFGCTVCHQGRGQAVEFPRTFHVPAADARESEAQKEERWEKDYGYDKHRHYWDFPMVPADKLYSSCFQCHQSTDRIPGVPEYNAAREQVEKLGCTGCHKIAGLEHLRKVGPDLTHIAAKTTEAWARKWVMDPRGFRPTTRMPHFWNQSNTGAEMKGPVPWDNNTDRFVPDWRARNDVEARAVVAYVFAQSKAALASDGYAPVAAPGTPGDAAAGATLFKQRGCLGCHSMERDQLVENTHGPELSKMGSKVTAAWLHDWVLNPGKYFPSTVMPDLRLSDAEAWDIAAYLVQGKDPAWEQRAEPKPDDTILDGIAAEYLAPSGSDAMAQAQVAEWRRTGGSAKVEQYVGEKLFARNGCSGCHLVPGHYEDKGIGTELTFEGLKELSKFDFGFEAAPDNPQKLPYTRHDFFKAKLHDPRVFDRMPVIAAHGGEEVIERYDMKVKAPGDKLKMPNFGLKDEQIELVTQFLMGLREDGIDSSMKHTLTADGQVLENASRLMSERNCMGCHQIGQLASTVALDEDVLEKHLWMAQPVKVDGRQVLAKGDWLRDEIYDPWEEDDADTLEFFDQHKLGGPLTAFGNAEGGIGKFIEEPAMRPPLLRGEGAKVNPDWLFGFLLAPFTVRTHVTVRMPTFGFTEEQATSLVRWFAANADQPWPF